MSRLKLSILFLCLGSMMMFSCSKDDEFVISELKVLANEEDGLLKVTWDQGDCEEVDIYRSEGAGEPIFYATPTLHHVFNDSDIEPGKTYNYMVVSTDPEGIESAVVSMECPEFGIRLGDVSIRQDGSDIIIDWSVRFAKADDNWKINISKATGELIETIENSNVTSGSATDKYGASGEMDNTLRYNIYLDVDDENVDSEEVKKFIEHTFKLAATNVQAEIKNSATQTINVKWDAAPEAEGYTVTAWINGSIIKMDDTTTETEVDITFSGGDPLEAGDKIEVLVTGYKIVDGKEYSSNSETVEFDWE